MCSWSEESSPEKEGTAVLSLLLNTVFQCITKVRLISLFLFKVLTGRPVDFSHKKRDVERTEQREEILPDFSGQAPLMLGGRGEARKLIVFCLEEGSLLAFADTGEGKVEGCDWP